MKSMVKLSATLAAFTVSASLCLALVHLYTKPFIDANAERAQNAGLRKIFPEATGFDPVANFPDSGSSSITFDKAYLARSDSGVLGAVVMATGATYKTSTLLVGTDLDRVLKPVVFIENTDTAGLGTKTAEPPFLDQFTGKSADDSFELGNDLDGITGATISARGVARIVQLAAYHTGAYLAEHHGGKAGSGSAPVIREAAPMSVEEALADIWGELDRVDVSSEIENTIERSVLLDEAWLMRDGDEVVGIAILARGQTYKASTILVAVRPDRTLAGIRIIETTDTKNYGYAMVEPDFYEMFTDKPVDDEYLVAPTVSDGDIDALSGATISTLGAANMIKIAAWEGSRYLAENHGGLPGPDRREPFVLNEIPQWE